MTEKSGVYKYYNGNEYDDIYFKTKASLVVEDDNHKFVSKNDIAKWNGKANTTIASTTCDGLMSKDDKGKLNNIAEGANKYVHPTSSGSKHIPSGGSKKQILGYNGDGVAAWVDPIYQKYETSNIKVAQTTDISSKDYNFIEWRFYTCNKTEISSIYLEINSTKGTFNLEGVAGGNLFTEVCACRAGSSCWTITWKCTHRDGTWEKITLLNTKEITSIRVHTGGTNQVFEGGRILMKMY